ncbi:Endonuclease/exonuclease/phosphatase [Obelidium mucronatum]|nr:Endonuclease/exonuclease/phosphatase [Obelidium mucronatum]
MQNTHQPPKRRPPPPPPPPSKALRDKQPVQQPLQQPLQQQAPPLPARPAASALPAKPPPPLLPPRANTNANTNTHTKAPPAASSTPTATQTLSTQAASLSRAAPAPLETLAAACVEFIHRGSLRCWAASGLLVVTVGERNLRVCSLKDHARELGVYSMGPGASLMSEKSSASLSSTSGGPADKESESKSSALCFVPTPYIEDSTKQVWLALQAGELISLDLSNLPQITLLDRKSNAHQSTVTHLLPVATNPPEIWSLDDQGGLRVWNSTADPANSASLTLSRSLARSLRIASRQSIALVVLQKYLWTCGGKFLEVNEPNCDNSSKVLKVKIDVTGTAANFMCLSGGGVEGGPVYSGHEDGKIIVWESSTFTKRYVVVMGIYKVSSLCVVERGKNIWAGFSNGKVVVVDTSVWDSWVIMKEFVAHSGSGGTSVVGAVVSGGNTNCAVSTMLTDAKTLAGTGNMYVISCAEDIGQIRVWDGFLTKDWKDSYMKEQQDRYCTYRDIPVFVGSWNINASKPESLESLPFSQQVLHQWFSQFQPNQPQQLPPPSIIVIGFQELVDLESKKANATQILKEITRSKTTKSDSRLQYWREKLVNVLAETLPNLHYRLLECHQLFGLFQCIFLLEDEYYKCAPGSISVSQVKTGMGGLHGNKGGIGTRIVVEDSSFCFVNCHLAAHQSQVSARNNDVVNIRDGITFASMKQLDGVFTQGGDGSLVLDHENVFFSGDLNYRIDLPRETVLSEIEHRNWPYLLEHDQLTIQLKTNPQFSLRAFSEGPIAFAPTFKYNLNSNEYDTSEKKRVPAWCDRILYKSSGLGGGGGGKSNVLGAGQDGIQLVSYERGECTMSDHRPVSALFMVRIKKVDKGGWEKMKVEANGVAKEHFRGVAEEWVRVRGIVSYS